MADRLVITFGPERTYERIDWLPAGPATQVRPEWPASVRRCSECKALVLAADAGGHDAWHQGQRPVIAIPGA